MPAAGQINSTWNTGNGTWNVATNWAPNDVPDNGGGLTYNVFIGNAPIAAGAQVTFVPEDGTSDTITSLIITNSGNPMVSGADLLTIGNQLLVIGQTTIDGAGSTIRVDAHSTPGTVAFNTNDLDLNNGGGLSMAGGIATIDILLEINNGTVGGHGTINVGDLDAVVEKAFENSSLIQASSSSAAAQTLFIHSNGIDTIDLDGDSETGVVDVSNALANINADTVTLVIDGPLSDAFGGTLQVGQRDTITFNQNFTMSGADVEMNGGTQTATMNGPAAVTSIASSAFTITGSAAINNDMTFSGALNTITVNASSTLTLGGTVTVPDASAFVFGLGSQFVVNGSTTITEAAGDFDWDGSSGAVTTTIGDTGVLTLNVDQVDVGGDTFNGTITLNGNGDLSITNTAGFWTMDGALHKTDAGTSTVSGASISLTGPVTVSAGTLSLPKTTALSASSLTADGTLILGADSVLAGPVLVSGTGLLRMATTSTVSANTTISVNTFDWDGNVAGSLHTINSGVIFTINSPNLDTDGDMDDPFTLAGSGAQLIVNGPAQWTANGTITANAAGSGTATIGGLSRMVLAGTLNVDGHTTISGPITFASGSTTAIDATMILGLLGGDLSVNANAIAGGTINGPGVLNAASGRALRGFGHINANIDFDGTANLRASGGMLTVAGAIVDVNVLGTADNTGVLNIVNPWETDGGVGASIGAVVLNGGVLQGGQITNDNVTGIQGNGLISSRVINTSKLVAINGGSLLVQTGGNNNDWDGASNTGALEALSGDLEMVDTTMPVPPVRSFGGSVRAVNNHRVFANGFALDFNPGSSLELENTATYRASSSTDIGGFVTIGAGANATLQVANNFFLTFEAGSDTKLNGNLTLINNNINVEDGAVFSGGGALIVPKGSHLVVDNLADVNVLLEMKGAFRPGNFNGIGRVNLLDYQQESGTFSNGSFTNGGELYVELIGTSLNQFDRLVAVGDVILGGYLNIDIDEISPGVPFVPSLGQTFNIITGNTVTGIFDYADVQGMPAGLTFHVEYLANAVQLQVVTKPIFSADFDEDGDVDWTDLAIWQGAYDLNQLGDANGDNITDNRDWVLWRDQFGSMPRPFGGSTVPEPGACSLLMAVCGLGALRRRTRRAVTTLKTGLICAMAMALLPAAAQARPTMNVVNNGAGQFVVQVASDPGLSGHSLAVELAFDVFGSDLSSATINTSAFGFNLPGDNPFAGATTSGVQINLATDKLFLSLGTSIPLTPGVLTNVATINTGAGPTALSWGGHFIDGATTPFFMTSRIAQAGLFFDGFQGVVNNPGALVGDFEPDGDVDAADIDQLFAATQGAVPPALAKFDLNRNSVVNSVPNMVNSVANNANSDADVWVRLLKHTEYGDANLDRKVDVADLGSLATNWQTPGGWAKGDFNGNGFIEVGDLGMLATKWQFGVGAPGPALADALAAFGLPATSVPEPTSLASLAATALLVSSRRRQP
jgi:autotransporter-associated beta strand protein